MSCFTICCSRDASSPTRQRVNIDAGRLQIVKTFGTEVVVRIV